MRFVLEIELGNDAMTDPPHVGDALVSLGNRLRDISGAFGPEEEGTLRDINGNTVGSWAIESEKTS